uniref:Protein kinase domain-containing protein n=1 Tax=Macrostomum lignano TaxID=282301 RepID=A0A1I8HUH6_9PLAT
MAPEIFSAKNCGYSFSVDWWTTGCLLFEFLVGFPPFHTPNGNTMHVIKKILSTEIQFPNFVKPDAKDMVNCLCQKNPHNRMGCQKAGPSAIREHAFFRDVDFVRVFHKQLPAPHKPTSKDDKRFYTGRPVPKNVIRISKTMRYNTILASPSASASPFSLGLASSLRLVAFACLGGIGGLFAWRSCRRGPLRLRDVGAPPPRRVRAPAGACAPSSGAAPRRFPDGAALQLLLLLVILDRVRVLHQILAEKFDRIAGLLLHNLGHSRCECRAYLVNQVLSLSGGFRVRLPRLRLVVTMASAAADNAPLNGQQQQQYELQDDASPDPTAEEPSVDFSSAGPTASVTYRRTKGRPSGPSMRTQNRSQQEQPLLESEEIAPDSPDAKSGGSNRGGYRTLMLLNVASLRADEQFTSSSRENLLEAADDNDEEDKNRPLVDGDIVGVAMSENGLAFLIFKDSPDILRLDTRSATAGGNLPGTAKACKVLQIRLRQGVKLHPTDVKVYKERLFVCGRLTRKIGEKSVALSAVARCNLDGVVELASKELPEPRFLGFDIDPTDDQLVVASPMPDGHGSQVFKMSSDFKEKKFKIQLGTRGDSWHRPEFVACIGGSSRCAGWLCSSPPVPVAWQLVSVWKFEGLQPGRLLALQSPNNSLGRLLMLSRDRGNIYSVSEEFGCFPLTHPASEGGQAFTAFCSLNERPAAVSSNGDTTTASATTIDILAATKDSLYLLQAS